MEDSLESKKLKCYMSIKEAEDNLPKIETLLNQLQSLHQTIHLLDSVEVLVDEEHYDKIRHLTKFNRAFHRISYEFYHKLDLLEELGCLIKDIDSGIIDFLYNFDGREVFLCWKQGEEFIDHWHEVRDGFDGRKKILDLERIK